MKKSVITIIVWAVMLLGVPAGAQSQEASPADPCGADIQQFCKDVQPGGGRIAACMKEHTQELSQACKGHVAILEKNVRLFTKACKGDVQKYCKGIKPGDGRLVFCLHDHASDLSNACRILLLKQNDKR